MTTLPRTVAYIRAVDAPDDATQGGMHVPRGLASTRIEVANPRPYDRDAHRRECGGVMGIGAPVNVLPWHQRKRRYRALRRALATIGSIALIPLGIVVTASVLLLVTGMIVTTFWGR